MKQKKSKNCTYIGGQAVIEGVMMRGKYAMATAVRDPDGEIQIEAERLPNDPKQAKWKKIPLIRGVINFIYSLIDGNKVLLRSASVAMPDEEEENPTKADQWLKEKHKIDVNEIFGTIAMILGILFSVGIFVAIPQFVTDFLPFEKTSAGLDGLWFNLSEGGIRLIVFVIYISAISLIPSLRRVYMCHGAEHKTITCYEKGGELTVENVKKCSRVHDRCGTTFLFLTVLVSILVFSLVNLAVVQWLYTGNSKLDGLIRFGFKVLLLPFVAGTSYEVLRLLAKTKSKIFWILKVPGLLLQRLTTREPEDGMIECAIAAFKTVLAMDEDQTVPERTFPIAGKMSILLKNTKKRFANSGIDEEEAEWIFALTLDIPKSSVEAEERILNLETTKEILRIADERLTGRPLWYVIGDTDFCGYKIKVDERVLIPRPETEEMAMMVVNAAEDGNSILDLCTGSGAIAIAVAKELEKTNKKVKITATDISEGALELAKENAEANEAEITFIQSDLFERIRGRFDVIVSNPPYIPTQEIENLQREVKDHEPRIALDGGADGLEIYRRIAEKCKNHLNKGGMLIMEVGTGEAQEVVKMFKGDNYSIVAQDFNGVERYVKIMM